MKWHILRYIRQRLIRRAPYGARGLKSIISHSHKLLLGRAPYGARGLKLRHGWRLQGTPESRPVWGAWIEIVPRVLALHYSMVAPRMGRVD